MYVPNHGRFLISTAPHEGFEKAGVVREHVLAFRAAGHEYEIRMASPIVWNRQAYNLYVRADPAYRPNPGQLDAVIVGNGKSEE